MCVYVCESACVSEEYQEIKGDLDCLGVELSAKL